MRLSAGVKVMLPPDRLTLPPTAPLTPVMASVCSSGSVSLTSRFATGMVSTWSSVPATVSPTATGRSFTAVTLTVTVADAVPPLASCTT